MVVFEGAAREYRRKINIYSQNERATRYRKHRGRKIQCEKLYGEKKKSGLQRKTERSTDCNSERNTQTTTK